MGLGLVNFTTNISASAEHVHATRRGERAVSRAQRRQHTVPVEVDGGLAYERGERRAADDAGEQADSAVAAPVGLKWKSLVLSRTRAP